MNNDMFIKISKVFGKLKNLYYILNKKKSQLIQKLIKSIFSYVKIKFFQL